jgi:hypothetical protein
VLGWIKYLRRVRVETDALKRNKDLASTRTLSPSFGTSGRRFKSCYSCIGANPCLAIESLLTNNHLTESLRDCAQCWRILLW